LFYIPFYGGLDVMRWNLRKNINSEKQDGLDMDIFRSQIHICLDGCLLFIELLPSNQSHIHYNTVNNLYAIVASKLKRVCEYQQLAYDVSFITWPFTVLQRNYFHVLENRPLKSQLPLSSIAIIITSSCKHIFLLISSSRKKRIRG
jgi:hypothetical protein